MSSNWPLAFLEFFVVIAFGLVYLVTDRIAKRAAKKYASSEAPDDAKSPQG
jgi:hypothetical protein